MSNSVNTCFSFLNNMFLDRIFNLKSIVNNKLFTLYYFLIINLMICIVDLEILKTL